MDVLLFILQIEDAVWGNTFPACISACVHEYVCVFSCVCSSPFKTNLVNLFLFLYLSLNYLLGLSYLIIPGMSIFLLLYATLGRG